MQPTKYKDKVAVVATLSHSMKGNGEEWMTVVEDEGDGGDEEGDVKSSRGKMRENEWW